MSSSPPPTEPVSPLFPSATVEDEFLEFVLTLLDAYDDYSELAIDIRGEGEALAAVMLQMSSPLLSPCMSSPTSIECVAIFSASQPPSPASPESPDTVVRALLFSSPDSYGL